MKVVCAWCQKSLPDKAPLEDPSVSHGICPKCAKAFEGEIEKNPKGYSGTLKLPIYIDTAISGVLNEGPRSLDWMWDRRMSVNAKKHFHDFLVSIHHPLAYEGMTPEQRFKRFVMEYVFPYIEKNPGAAWHGSKEMEADRQDRHATKKSHKDFFHGKSVAHLESKLAARALKMNPLAVFTVGNPRKRLIKEEERARVSKIKRLGREAVKRYPSFRYISKMLRKNPPKRLNVGIAGVVYNRVLEIRAEKTEYQPGLYKHPFDRKSRVEVLALDNGDLLLHSTAGVRLWGLAT